MLFLLYHFDWNKVMSYIWLNFEHLLCFYLYKVNSTLHNVRLNLISYIEQSNTGQTLMIISLHVIGKDYTECNSHYTRMGHIKIMEHITDNCVYIHVCIYIVARCQWYSVWNHDRQRWNNKCILLLHYKEWHKKMLHFTSFKLEEVLLLTRQNNSILQKDGNCRLIIPKWSVYTNRRRVRECYNPTLLFQHFTFVLHSI